MRFDIQPMCGGTMTVRPFPDFGVSIRQVPRCVTARDTLIVCQWTSETARGRTWELPVACHELGTTVT